MIIHIWFSTLMHFMHAAQMIFLLNIYMLIIESSFYSLTSSALIVVIESSKSFANDETIIYKHFLMIKSWQNKRLILKCDSFTKVFNIIIYTSNVYCFINVTHTTFKLKNIIQLKATMIKWEVFKTICRSKQCFYWNITMMLYTNIM